MSGTDVKSNVLDNRNTAVLEAVHPAPPIHCTIGLDSFGITNTRSLHEDTDFVTVSLAIGKRPALSMTRALGDRNNGHFPLNMHFANVAISPGETAVLTYNMVNNGHQPPGKVEQALQKATETLAQKGAQIAATAIGGAIGAELGASIGTAVVPILGTAIGALAGWLVGGGFGLLFANCDGPVASAVHVLTFAQIQGAKATGFGLSVTDDHPGVDLSGRLRQQFPLHRHLVGALGPFAERHRAESGHEAKEA